MIILTWFLNADIDAVFLASVVKISPKLNINFECPHPRLEFCHKCKQDFTIRRRCQILYFCMSVAACLVPVDVI